MVQVITSFRRSYCDCGAESGTWYERADGEGYACPACFAPCEKCGEHVAESATDLVDLHSTCVRAFLGCEPCPNTGCGKAPEYRLGPPDNEVRLVYLSCPTCHNLVGSGESEAQALDAWNELAEWARGNIGQGERCNEVPQHRSRPRGPY